MLWPPWSLGRVKTHALIVHTEYFGVCCFVSSQGFVRFGDRHGACLNDTVVFVFLVGALAFVNPKGKWRLHDASIEPAILISP